MSTKTISERFRDYENDALDRVSMDLDDLGMDSDLVGWMESDQERLDTLRSHLFYLGHAVVMARNDNARVEATDKFRKHILDWSQEFIDSWSDDTRAEFMAEIDRETALAIAMDREEGNDE